MSLLNKYIIDCNIKNYELTNNLLINMNIIILNRMINLDKTNDFIIFYTDKDAKILKSSGCHIVLDHQIIYDLF